MDVVQSFEDYLLKAEEAILEGEYHLAEVYASLANACARTFSGRGQASSMLMRESARRRPADRPNQVR